MVEGAGSSPNLKLIERPVTIPIQFLERQSKTAGLGCLNQNRFTEGVVDKINETEMRRLASRPTETRLTETRSLPESSAVMLAGMLHLAAAQAKTTLTQAESAMWARQVQNCSPDAIEQFFTEWMASNHFMPAYADFHEWLEARVEQSRYENVEYWAQSREEAQRVEDWRKSPSYERDLTEIRGKMEAVMSRSKPVTLDRRKREIPLAFSAERERELLAKYARKEI